MTQSELSAIIKAKMLALRNNTDDPEGAAGDFADMLAQGVHDYVLGLQITYTAGLVAPSGGGPVTGVFTNTLILS
jgi:hypothetical protein